ncbi:MAG: hypothetical protein ACKVYV_00980 [Limisphaerales bacterium]
MKFVLPVSLALAGTCASASVFVLGDATRTLEAATAAVLDPNIIIDPGSGSLTKTGTGEWTPPGVHADSTYIFNGRILASSEVFITHSSDVSGLQIRGDTSIKLAASVDGFPGYARASATEAFSVAFSLTEPTPMVLSNDTTLVAVVGGFGQPVVSGAAELSFAAGGVVLSLPLFADGSAQALLQPGDYVFTANSTVTARTLGFVLGDVGFEGSNSYSLTVVPEAEQYGLAAAAGLLGFGLWRRRAATR